MRKYLATLHMRSPEHKKRFSLVVSATFTLLIFSIWSIVTFDSPNAVTARNADDNRAEVEVSTASPLSSLRAGAAAAIQSFKWDFNKAKEGELEVVHRESGDLNMYGR